MRGNYIDERFTIYGGSSSLMFTLVISVWDRVAFQKGLTLQY